MEIKNRVLHCAILKDPVWWYNPSMILNHCNVVPKNCWIFQKQNWWCNEKWGDLLGIGLVIGRIIPIESQLFIESSFWGLMLAAHIITSWNSSQYWKLVMIRKKLRRRHTTIGFMSILRGRMEYPSQFACQTGEVKKVQPYDWCYYCMTHLLMNTKSIIGAIFHHEKKYVHFKVCYDIVDVIGIILKCPPWWVFGGTLLHCLGYQAKECSISH